MSISLREFLLVPKALLVALVAVPALLIAATCLGLLGVLLYYLERRGVARVGGLYADEDHLPRVMGAERRAALRRRELGD